MASKPQDLRLNRSNKHRWPPVTQALNPFGKQLVAPTNGRTTVAQMDLSYLACW